MRKKPWAQEELNACPFFTDAPEKFINTWHERFAKHQPLHVELGCGKGGFISRIAVQNPEINYIAIDIKDAVLGLAVRKTIAAYEEAQKKPENVWIAAQEITVIKNMLGENDTVDRIYINFCNPWPRTAHWKRRLTHPRQLEQYKIFMPHGEIHFKTDDDELFAASMGYFKESGFETVYLTNDLHQSGYEHNIMTEHEIMYMQEGKKINFTIQKI